MPFFDLILAGLPLFYFQFIASVTPGPNNVMLTASGMNFGYRRTLPHIMGIVAGFFVLIMLCALGIGAVYEAFPQIDIALKVLGGAYLVYLAYKISQSGRVGLSDEAQKARRPMRFIESAAFQFVNPKAVIFAIAAVSIPDASLGLVKVLVIIGVSSIINAFISTHVWTFFGTLIAELFRDDKMRRIINSILALALLAMLPMMVL